MKILGIIPARYQSSRFPGKPLVEILGKPLIIWVSEIVEKALGKENFVVATEDERILKVVESHGYKAIITSDKHLTGTDRLAEVAQQINADVYVNIQGDEPMIDYRDIIRAVDLKIQYPDFIINAMTSLTDTEDPKNINIPKVLVNKFDELIYMSRLPIPGVKGGQEEPIYLKQVCIYAFTKNELSAYGQTKQKAEYEKFEDIEILRFFDLGYKIKMFYTDNHSLAVDIPEDVEKVEAELKTII
ncbi:3-deoxy-manno-octulosonate cytidylyltransferase [Sphingobacterium multivorum]|uniref:3-deoxy-manno-octulosonate cytidylyltransferase n=1 Tax=Sphingobacterium multivorum TaxID=28454 RepID=UPI0028ADD8F2|nr:3-deoxy-manno-octulosonate cytidylyltransferase [Sphingobacterium multivorum]